MNRKALRSGFWQSLFVLLFFVLLSLWMTRPWSFHLADHVFEKGDTLLTTWILSWDCHALTTNPFSLFDANIFYPTQKSLTFSEHMLGNLPLFAPVYALSGNPVLGLNVVVFLSFVLSGWLMFLLVHYLTRNFCSAIIAGTIYAFAPIRFSQLGHMQLLSLEWLPLAFLFLDQWLRTKRFKYWCCFTVFLSLQLLVSYYLAYMSLIALGIYLTTSFLLERKLFEKRTWTSLSATVIVVATLLIPLSLPYWESHRTNILPDYLNFSIVTSADPLKSYLTVPGGSIYQPLLGRFRSKDYGWEKTLFPGSLPVVLILLGGILFYRFRGSSWQLESLAPAFVTHPRILMLNSSLITLSAYLLSLGPYLTINDKPTTIPLPYLLLYKILPGFSSLRVPARFGLMVMFGLSILAGLSALVVLRQIRCLQGRQMAFGAVCLLILLWEFNVSPLPVYPIQTGAQVPPVYHWLARHGEHKALLELPFGNTTINVQYVYFSIYHWLPLVNGYSGYFPPSFKYIQDVTRLHPDSITLKQLSEMGVHWLLLHRAALSLEEKKAWDALAFDAQLQLVKIFGEDQLYRLVALSPKEIAPNFFSPQRLLRETFSGIPLKGLPEEGFHMEIVGNHLPQVMEREKKYLGWVTVRNTSPIPWPCFAAPGASYAVNLSYHWLSQEGKKVEDLPSLRSFIPRDLRPGEETTIPIEIYSQRTLGQYILQITLVQEHWAWFEDRGARPFEMPVVVK